MKRFQCSKRPSRSSHSPIPLDEKEAFEAKFSAEAEITSAESNLLFSVTHKSDGSCCTEAWTDEVMEKDRKFKDKRNAAEAEDE